MRNATAKSKPAPIGAQCECERATFGGEISYITPDGCSFVAASDWVGDHDFLHLTIADKIEINGRVLWQKGRLASIAFFGQIHPAVVAQLSRRAA